MKYSVIVTAAAAIAVTSSFAQELTTEKERASYSVGVQLGNAIESGESLLDIDVLIRGLRDALDDKDLAMTDAEMAEAFQGWQVQARDAQAKEMSAEGDAFLAENAEREGVTVLPSGLQYEVLEEGNGATPTSNDTIRAHYKGTLLDGTVFDSSYDRGQPIEAPVTGLIPGWTEALQLMQVGDKWKLYIPQNLAYGAQGAGGAIPPYATLIFEMELVEIVNAP